MGVDPLGVPGTASGAKMYVVFSRSDARESSLFSSCAARGNTAQHKMQAGRGDAHRRRRRRVTSASFELRVQKPGTSWSGIFVGEALADEDRRGHEKNGDREEHKRGGDALSPPTMACLVVFGELSC